MPALVTVVAVLLGGALLGIVGALVAITAAHGPCAARRRRALPRLDHTRTPTVLGTADLRRPHHRAPPAGLG